MINKKNVLGKTPQELGEKDAIHVAIVAVRADGVIHAGARVGMNEFGEAFETYRSDKKVGVGVADPFRKNKIIATGEVFWLLIDQADVPNVQHVWEHPKVSFGIPTKEVKYNSYIKEDADSLGLTYQELMDAAAKLVYEDKQSEYKGSLTSDELEEIMEDFEWGEFWDNWSDETGHEFENYGSSCCPEYYHPEDALFPY